MRRHLSFALLSTIALLFASASLATAAVPRRESAAQQPLDLSRIVEAVTAALHAVIFLLWARITLHHLGDILTFCSHLVAKIGESLESIGGERRRALLGVREVCFLS